jgi:hypothetical protein
LHIKDPVWCEALDAIIGRYLGSFIALDRGDVRLLQGVLSKHKHSNDDVFVVKPDERFDFSRNVPDCPSDGSFTSVVNVLEV